MSVVRIEQCPLCAEEGRDTAADNLQIFDSGVRYCIAGHEVIGKEDSEDEEKKPIKKQKEKPAGNSGKFKEGVFGDITTRRISKRTCQFYDYQLNYELGIHIANYHDDAGNVVMQHTRDSKKNFSIIGDKDYNMNLWGLDKFTPKDNLFITITEGQLDALSVAEVFGCKWPVVSLPCGVGNADKVLEHNMHKLDGFKYVVLAFDSDKPGREAMEKCIRLFEPGRVRTAHWRLKDASEMLQQGLTAEISSTIHNAVEYIPSPIITGASMIESLKGTKRDVVLWPWESANRKIQPILRPSVISVAARAKVGKTIFLTELARHTISQGKNIGWISLEQTPQQTYLKSISSMIERDLSEVYGRELTDDELDLAATYQDRIVIYDHVHYGTGVSDIINTIPYMVKSLDCDFIIFDNLSFAASTLGTDERLGIDKSMIAFKNSTVKYNYTFFNVCHLKRPDGYEDPDSAPSIADIRGSQGIEMYSDYVIGLTRDVGNEDDYKRNVLKAWVLADRNTGQDTGKYFYLKYNPENKKLGDM